MKIGALLALARELKGMTLRELERSSGVSNALISQIETGKVKDPGFSIIVRISDALGLPLNRVAATARPFTDKSVLRKAREPASRGEANPNPPPQGPVDD